MDKNLLRLLIILILGPPALLCVVPVCALFVYLTQPFCWVVLLLLFGVCMVGLVLWGAFKQQPNPKRFPGWSGDGTQD